MIISLCKFFQTVPSVILKEDAEIVQLVKLYQLANPGEDSSSG